MGAGFHLLSEALQGKPLSGYQVQLVEHGIREWPSLYESLRSPPRK